jgi:hypothetical protein
MDDLARLEKIAQELVEAFEIHAPPVPIESMLQHPKEGMWDKIDINQLSGTFLSFKSKYSPRMSMARMLARHVASSKWGISRGVLEIMRKDETHIRAFARMIVMPQEMVKGLSAGARNPVAMSMQFEVPEDDARQRLQEVL